MHQINRYIFNGNTNADIGNKFIYSNYLLPHKTNSTIPFSFGITKNNEFKLVNSNIFYFETFLDTYDFRTPLSNEILKIGFSYSSDNPNNIDFGKNSFGIDIFNNYMS